MPRPDWARGVRDPSSYAESREGLTRRRRHDRSFPAKLEAVYQDTNPAMVARYYEHLRAKAPYERLAQAASLTRMTRELAVAGIRQRHPDASDDEIRKR